jgi:hypothetical protein
MHTFKCVLSFFFSRHAIKRGKHQSARPTNAMTGREGLGPLGAIRYGISERQRGIGHGQLTATVSIVTRCDPPACVSFQHFKRCRNLEAPERASHPRP